MGYKFDAQLFNKTNSFHSSLILFNKDNSNSLLLLFKDSNTTKKRKWVDECEWINEFHSSALDGASAHNPQQLKEKLIFFNSIKRWPALPRLMNEEGRIEQEEKKMKQLHQHNHNSIQWVKGIVGLLRSLPRCGAAWGPIPFALFAAASLFLLNKFNEEREIAFTPFSHFILKLILPFILNLNWVCLFVFSFVAEHWRLARP